MGSTLPLWISAVFAVAIYGFPHTIFYQPQPEGLQLQPKFEAPLIMNPSPQNFFRFPIPSMDFLFRKLAEPQDDSTIGQRSFPISIQVPIVRSMNKDYVVRLSPNSEAAIKVIVEVAVDPEEIETTEEGNDKGSSDDSVAHSVHDSKFTDLSIYNLTGNSTEEVNESASSEATAPIVSSTESDKDANETSSEASVKAPSSSTVSYKDEKSDEIPVYASLFQKYFSGNESLSNISALLPQDDDPRRYS
jgi:hypothetical protein